MTQLLTVLRDWTNGLALGEIIDVIYTDFTKAFDSVPHVRLLSKLEKYGIQGNILGWIQSFLSGICQRVGVEGSVCNWTSVTSEPALQVEYHKVQCLYRCHLSYS